MKIKSISIIAIIIIAFIYYSKPEKNEKIIEKEIIEKEIIIPEPTIDEIIKKGVPQDTIDYGDGIIYSNNKFSVIENIINPGEALSHILTKHNISSSDLFNLEIISKDIFDLRNIQSGKNYTIIHSNDSLKTAKCFIYEKSKIEYIVFDFRDSINVYKDKKEVKYLNNTISGTIKKGESLWISLYRELNSEKVPALVDILANDIYAWTIDFSRFQENDSYKVYYEEMYVSNEYVGVNKIYAATIKHKGKIINAFRYNENEKYADYFDENGNNLRSAFLKSPIDFVRVSSSFGNRKHPISGKWKKHKGTDYAAKTGTPIMSTANGTVTFASWKGGYGNCVIIKHGEKYKTLYAHLSKFKKGVGKGTYVKQGDIIGYVGSTGYSTGPHLHYEFFVNGVQVDHYKQDLPPSEPLSIEHKESFEKIRNNYIKILDNFVK